MTAQATLRNPYLPNSFSDSENYSICEENNYNSSSQLPVDEKSSTATKYNSINFEEMNYNSASNHMKNFNKYSTKKKHIFTKEGSSGILSIWGFRGNVYLQHDEGD